MFPLKNTPLFRTPFGAIVCGPTLSGKSEFVFSLLQNREKAIQNCPERVVYCYGENQPGFDRLRESDPTIEFVKGLKQVLDQDDYFDPLIPTLLILDDLGQEVADDKRSSQLFTQKIHHRNVSLILIMQNLYKQGRSMRDVSLNAQYLILFKSVRDVGQINTLARQMGLPHLPEAYRKVTSEPWTPIVIDMKPDCADYLRVRSHVLPGQITRIYVSKKTPIPQEQCRTE